MKTSMFDFVAAITDKEIGNPFKGISEGEFNAKVFEFRSGRIRISGLYRVQGYHPVFKNGYLLFIYGNIFRRNNIKNSDSLPEPSEIMDDILSDKNNIRNYKGNFMLALFHTGTEHVTVFSSQLGIKHAYYHISGKDFYLSSNLNILKKISGKINYSSILQYLLFTYTLAGETFLDGIKFINPGEILEFGNKFTATGYYDIRDMFVKSLSKFDINEYIRLFNKSIEQRCSSGDNVYSSFTGGFDGRTILSYLLKTGKKIRTYSFGKINGENTSVPASVANAIGFDYTPIYLEEEYEKSYRENARKVIYYSDGISFNERANYIYSFGKLSKTTNHVISGLIGGETLRPVHLRTDYMNQNYFDAFYTNTQTDSGIMLTSGYPLKLFGFNTHEAIEEVNAAMEAKRDEIRDLKNEFGYLFYMIDLMMYGFRMYYGTEIHYERYFCENLTPYYDLDLLEYIFSTDYVNIFRNAFRENRLFRWKGQKIYARIIEANYPVLNKYPVDRGYPPGYLLNPLKLTLVPYLYYKRKQSRESRPDFNESAWSKYFLKDYIREQFDDNVINDNYLKSLVEGNLKGDSGHDQALTRLVSLQTWLNMR